MEARKTGTTVVAIKTKEGVVIASDKRVTMGYMIHSKDGKKIVELTDKIAMAAAGLYADLQYLSKILSANLRIRELRSNKEVTANEAAHLLSAIMYSQRFYPYYVEVIIAGKDGNDYGIYTLDAAGSVTKEEKFIATGSGMMFALGVLESEYKEDMSIKKAKELAKKAVRTAIERDAGSGDGIEIVTITNEGVTREVIKLQAKAQ